MQNRQQQEQLLPANEVPQQHGILGDEQPVLQIVHQPVQHHGQAAQQAGQQAPAWQSYNSVFTAAKAGMGGVDQQKVKQVVYEMSKNSAHFANEQRKQAQTNARIARLKAQAAQVTPAQLAASQRTCDAKITLLEAGRELDKVWLHVDMDAFYASVEELDRPDLKDKPMAVGGMGMICTANYLARQFGVRSAMPGFIAKKLCPQLVFVKPEFKKYTAASAKAFAVFRSYDERVEGASLDEAYLDITQHCNTHGLTGEQVAAELRSKVIEATRGLTCSVGVAPNMMLAKIASDKNKPNGQCVVGATRDEVMAFIADLPIRKIPGIGKVMEQTLQALGVSTCSDLITQAALLTALLSDISSSSLMHAGLGLGATEHSSRGGGTGSSEPGRKGISCERTFSAMSNTAEMEQMAESLVQHLASDMASEDIEAKTLTLKLKTTTFEVRTRAVTLPSYVSSAAAMLPPILKLLRAELPVEIRLMGVRGSNLRKAPQRLDQLAAEGKKLNALERLVLQGRQKQQQQAPDQGLQEQGYHAQEQLHAEQLGQLQDQQGQQQPRQTRQHWEQQGDGLHIWEGEDDVADVDASDGECMCEVMPQEGLLLQPMLCIPTQEQLQVEYDHQCKTQEQHELDAADLVDAAEEGEGRQQQHPPQKIQQLFGPVDVRQEAAAGKQQQQQQLAHGDDMDPSMQPSKRRRRSFNAPAHSGLQDGAAVLAAPVAPAGEPQEQHCLQRPGLEPEQQQGEEIVRQWEQQDQCDAYVQPMQQTCWQKASALQSQQHLASLLQQHDQQLLQQQQHVSLEQVQQSPDVQVQFQVPQAAAAGGAVTGQQQGSRQNKAMCAAGSGHRSTGWPWTCLACTFSDNKQKWLRCSVCETPKGETQPPPQLLQTLPGRVGRAAGAGGPGGSSRAGGGGRAGASSNQMTLERLGIHKRPKH